MAFTDVPFVDGHFAWGFVVYHVQLAMLNCGNASETRFSDGGGYYLHCKKRNVAFYYFSPGSGAMLYAAIYRHGLR